MITASIAGSLLAAALTAGPTYAPAVDHRPCVSAREFNGYHTALTRADLEARWEVKGLGRVAAVPEYGRAVIYPRCGYPMRTAWYGVHYTKDRRGRLWGEGVVWWHKQPAPETPAETPTPAPTPTEPPQLIPA